MYYYYCWWNHCPWLSTIYPVSLLPYRRKVWQIYSFRVFGKKVWWINRSANRSLTISTNWMALVWWITNNSPTFPLYGIFLRKVVREFWDSGTVNLSSLLFKRSSLSILCTCVYQQVSNKWIVMLYYSECMRLIIVWNNRDWMLRRHSANYGQW